MKINRLNQVYASILIDAIYQMKNYPITLVSNVIAPFSVLILIILVSHGQLLSISIEGALITSMISSGVTLQIDLSHIKNDFKLQDMLIQLAHQRVHVHAGDGDGRSHERPTGARRSDPSLFSVHTDQLHRGAHHTRSVCLGLCILCLAWLHALDLQHRYPAKPGLREHFDSNTGNDSADLLSYNFHPPFHKGHSLSLTRHLCSRDRPECNRRTFTSGFKHRYRLDCADRGFCRVVYDCHQKEPLA